MRAKSWSRNAQISSLSKTDLEKNVLPFQNQSAHTICCYLEQRIESYRPTYQKTPFRHSASTKNAVLARSNARIYNYQREINGPLFYQAFSAPFNQKISFNSHAHIWAATIWRGNRSIGVFSVPGVPPVITRTRQCIPVQGNRYNGAVCKTLNAQDLQSFSA